MPELSGESGGNGTPVQGHAMCFLTHRGAWPSPQPRRGGGRETGSSSQACNLIMCRGGGRPVALVVAQVTGRDRTDFLMCLCEADGCCFTVYTHCR